MLRKAKPVKASTCPSDHVSWRWSCEIPSSPTIESRSSCLPASAQEAPQVIILWTRLDTQRDSKSATPPTCRWSNSKDACLSRSKIRTICDAPRPSATTSPIKCLTVRLVLGITPWPREPIIISSRILMQARELSQVSVTATLSILKAIKT